MNMPVPTAEASWGGSLLWLVGLAAAAFGIAWLSGTRLHIRKGLYIPLLLGLTAALALGYLAWLGVGFVDVLGHHWGWGLLGAVVSGLLLVGPVRRQPVDRPVYGRQRASALAWEGLPYGIAEGVLLSALPPFMAWQMAHSRGWTGVAQWALSIGAAAAVVVIHHLGYWSCRNRILLPISLGLTVLTVAFLVTGSWIAPALGHVFVHVTCILHGAEMPPHDRPVPVAEPEAAILRPAAA